MPKSPIPVSGNVFCVLCVLQGVKFLVDVFIHWAEIISHTVGTYSSYWRLYFSLRGKVNTSVYCTFPFL